MFGAGALSGLCPHEGNALQKGFVEKPIRGNHPTELFALAHTPVHPRTLARTATRTRTHTHPRTHANTYAHAHTRKPTPTRAP